MRDEKTRWTRVEAGTETDGLVGHGGKVESCWIAALAHAEETQAVELLGVGVDVAVVIQLVVGEREHSVGWKM